MKIVVICTVRSGTTTLIDGLSNSLSIVPITIPYDYYGEYNFDTLLNQAFNRRDTIVRFSPIQQEYSFVESIIKKFDFCILLDRKNKQEQYESFLWMVYCLSHSNNRLLLHSSYDLDSIPKLIKENPLNEDKWKNILSLSNQMHTLSDRLNIPILYYEDLFYSNKGFELLSESIPFLDIYKLKEYFSSTSKLRTTKIKSVI